MTKTCLTAVALSAATGLAATSPAALCPPFERKPKPAPIDNTALVGAFKDEGGRILHAQGQHPGVRGVTFAFKLLPGRIQFATGVQHRNDDFTRKVGTQTAVEHFNAGRTVFLPTTAKTLSDAIAILYGLAHYPQA